MSKRHNRTHFYLADQRKMVGESERPATASERTREFRFSQIVPGTAPGNSDALLAALADIMTAADPGPDSAIPAGFTYLGQFVDHDLTRDVTQIGFGTNVPVDHLDQGRSPALDLDSVYGEGPDHPDSAGFYLPNRIHLKLGRTTASPPEVANRPLDGFDLPRKGAGGPPAEARLAHIGDPRNDENLAVAQTHLAFMRFHNKVCDLLAARGVPSALLFERAREAVVKHYQFMLKTDFLPRIVDPVIVTDVFKNGRRFFEVGATGFPTMPLEFSVAAYRLGHSMIRNLYDWNAVFGPVGPFGPNLGTLENLFRFSGTSGNLNPRTDLNDPIAGDGETLPTNWVADWTLLFDFVADGVPELAPEPGHALNMARLIDVRLTNPLKSLPLGSFGARGTGVPPNDPRLNLAFRNLVRGRMVRLATAQQVVAAMSALGIVVTPLTSAQIIGTECDALPEALRNELVTETPLWFYILREAGLNGGKLGSIGGRIVAEVFHRAMEGSRISLLRDASFQPSLGRRAGMFRMTDLLTLAYNASAGELRPLSPAAPRPPTSSTRPADFS